MARKIEEIQNEMLQTKASILELDALDSTSKTAIYRLWIYVFAVAIWMLEKQFDIHKSEIEIGLAKAPDGTNEWYVGKCLEFQYGDTLAYVNNSSQYLEIDKSKRIITRASYKENDKLYLKVAKDGSLPGTLVALNSDELMQLKGYLDRTQFPGVNIEVSSLNADRLRVYADVYFDASVLNTDVKDNVSKAISSYLKNLSFDGNVLVSRMIDAIQTVEGVIDVYLHRCEGYSGTNLEEFDRKYECKAGYILEDNSEKFIDTITFIPE